MDRKNFISSLVIAGSTVSSFGKTNEAEEPEVSGIIPPYLKPGDRIGITSPAGYITEEEIQPAAQLMESWGFRIKTGFTIGKRDNTFGGTDEERTNDFQQMLDAPEIKAIMCARGGYGMVRIIDKLNFKKFINRPKWVIGFSDITVFHCHVIHNYGIATLHSKMTNSFPEDWSKAEPIQVQTINSIRSALTGEKIHYNFPLNELNKKGKAEGMLVGGNLKTIETLVGTASELHTKGKILFVEDTGEYLYSIDRMFWHLKRSGKLSGLKGLIVGGFKIKPDDPGEEFGKTVQEIVLEKIKEYDYPVCFDFPVGHQKNNFALKCGVTHRLIVGNTENTLSETT